MQSSSKIIALVMGANKSAGSLRTVIGAPADRACPWLPVLLPDNGKEHHHE